MKCLRCGSDRIFQFEPRRQDVKDSGQSYPAVCRACGVIHHNGEVLELGAAAEAMERTAADMADLAKKAGEQARLGLEADPRVRIEAYFARVYGEAYLDGFLRAYAFLRHESKEGRLKRIRELWSETRLDPEDSSYQETLVAMRPEVYAEISQLLLIGDTDAASRANIRSARK